MTFSRMIHHNLQVLVLYYSKLSINASVNRVLALVVEMGAKLTD